MSTTTQHGATHPGDKGDIPAFCGTEGLLIATQLSKRIKLYLGSLNSRDFLTTPQEEILDVVRIKLEDQPSLLYKEEKSIKDRWSKCYWWIRSLFKVGSTADSHFNPCDDEMDIPMLWKIFQKQYLGGDNVHLGSTIFSQLFDPKAVMSNPLDEFSRLFDLETKLDELEQSSELSSDIAVPSQTKTTVARALNFDAAARSTPYSAQAAPFTEEQSERMIEAMAAIVQQTLLKKKKKDQHGQASPLNERDENEKSRTVDLMQILTSPKAKDYDFQDGELREPSMEPRRGGKSSEFSIAWNRRSYTKP